MKKAKQQQLASLNRPVAVYATARLEAASAAFASDQQGIHYKCTACHTEVAFAHSGSDAMSPMCPQCGGILHDGAENPVHLDPIPEDDLTAVQCTGCGTHNVFEDQTLSVLGGKVHCSVCASALHYETAASDEDDPDDDGDDIDLDAIDLEDDDAAPAAEDAPATDDGASPEEEATLSPSVAGVEDENPLDNGVPPGPDNPKSIDSDDKAVGIAPKGASQAIHEEDIGKQLIASEDSDDGSDDLDLPLDEAVDPDGDISLLDDEENARVLACVNGVPVFELQQANCTNPARFKERSFRRALLQQANVSGFAGLRKEGFAPLVVQAPINRIVTARVTAFTARAHQRIQASADNLAEDMEQCLQLASVAIARNLKRVDNPLATRLTAMLASSGVHNADRVVARELATAGMEYARSLLALANDYRSKSVEFRNELAEALSDAAPEGLTDLNADEDDEAPTAIESRVTAGVRPASKSSSTAQTASVGGLDPRDALRRVRELSKKR